MKKALFTFSILFALNSYSQEHFAGLSTSSRGGIIKAGINPAELANSSNRFEVNIFGSSINVANNKIGFSDITSGKNLESLIFQGNDPVNMRFNAEVYGPGVAIKLLKWSFGITTKASGKLDIIDVDSKLGDAIMNSDVAGYIGSSTSIKSDLNQRLVGTTWGEVGLTVARPIIDNDKLKVSVGGTLKLMFPGSYSNIGLDKFNGKVIYDGVTQNVYVKTDDKVTMNIAYSGGLANSFSNFSDYSKSVYGALNGFVGDIGINFQLRDKSVLDAIKSKNKYKLNAGIAVRNIGSMTFKDDNNYSTNYSLDLRQNLTDSYTGNDNPNGINLNQFQNVDNLQQVETILTNNGYLGVTSPQKKDFVVKLPTVVNLNLDLKLISKLYISGYLQQKLNDDNQNDQISAQNIITVTPRINLGFFEAYLPVSNSEISGFNGGLGFRLGGFYLGSGSVLTALTSDTKQADIYLGFRWGFL